MSIQSHNKNKNKRKFLCIFDSSEWLFLPIDSSDSFISMQSRHGYFSMCFFLLSSPSSSLSISDVVDDDEAIQSLQQTIVEIDLSGHKNSYASYNSLTKSFWIINEIFEF